MSSPSVVSLFSGVGGLELGIERWIGAKPACFVERSPYCRAVLRKHWPDVEIADDVRTFDASRFAGADIVAGGFPCQDVSTMGPKTGLDGARSGLWSEFTRIIAEVSPRAVIIENVAALRTRGLDRVLADLADLGFDAAWTTLEGREAGLSIRRARVFVLAVANGERSQRESQAWLHDHRALGHDSHRRDAGLVWPRGEPSTRADPQPGIHRGADGPSEGLDARRRRERLRCVGNAVAPAQAALALDLLLDMLDLG